MAKDEPRDMFLDSVQAKDGWCGAMEEVPGYVFKNYHRLLTSHEHAAWSAIMQQDKAISVRGRDHSKLTGMPHENTHREIAEECYAEAVKDDRVRALLDQGVKEFYKAVATRILQEHAAEVVINRCPQCRALCITPRAKQCRACFHDWH